MNAGDEGTAAVETVRAYFSDAGAPPEAFLSGAILEWWRLRDSVRLPLEYERTRTLDHVELIELRGTSAIVALRAQERVVVRGGPRILFHYEGPVVLERRAEGWRIVDYSLDGRRRIASLVPGPLARQEQDGVALTVLGANRAARATEILVEAENRGVRPVTPARAFARTRGWQPAFLGPREPIGAGEVRRLLAQVQESAKAARPELAIALELRTDHRLPFAFDVPFRRPEQLVTTEPPARLPLRIRAKLPFLVAFDAALTGVIAWQWGWVALAIPLALAYVLRRALPARLQPWRRPLAAIWLAGVLFFVWRAFLY